MSDVQTGAPSGGEAVPNLNDGGTAELSVHDAARVMAEHRNKLMSGAAPAAVAKATSQPPVSQPSSAPEAPAADQSADEADANPPEGHGETQEAEAEQEPPIDPPVSWTTAEKERWQSIPRDTQEYIAQRETEREKLLTQKSKEAEEQLKGLTAREQAMEQQRLQMEAITIAKAEALRKVLQRDFADIQTFDDVKKLAAEDWARYNQWQVFQQELAAESAEAQAAQQRQATEAQAKFAKFADEQDKKFIERAPDFADQTKAARLKEGAIAALKDAGFSPDELNQYWSGQAGISMRDHRVQLLFADAARYRQAQESAKKTVANKSLPPVQRPGVAQSGRPAIETKIQSVKKQLRTASGLESTRLAATLMRLNRGEDVPL